MGRNRTQELHEFADFLVSTGLRPGELFALRWEDVDLDTEPPTAFVNATVIRTSTGGVRIQDHPKSQHGIRRVALPSYVVFQLHLRRSRQTSSTTANPLNLIFPSSTGTVCDPNNVGKTWRKAADAIGYGWVTLKTFRKANATLIARTMGVEAAAYQAGHSKVSMTPQALYRGIQGSPGRPSSSRLVQPEPFGSAREPGSRTGTRRTLILVSLWCVKVQMHALEPHCRTKTAGQDLSGASCRIRTDDPRFTRAVLWPTELRRRALMGRAPQRR